MSGKNSFIKIRSGFADVAWQEGGLNMKDLNSLAYTKWAGKSHIVFAPKNAHR